MAWNRLRKHHQLLFLIYLERAMTHPEIICFWKKRKKQHSSPLSVFPPQNVTVNITLMYVIASVLSLGRKASNPFISQLLLLSRNKKNRLQMHYSNVCNINIKEVWAQLQISLFLKCLWKTTCLFCLEDICSLCRGSSLAPGSLRVSELRQVAHTRTWGAHGKDWLELGERCQLLIDKRPGTLWAERPPLVDLGELRVPSTRFQC